MEEEREVGAFSVTFNSYSATEHLQSEHECDCFRQEKKGAFILLVSWSNVLLVTSLFCYLAITAAITSGMFCFPVHWEYSPQHLRKNIQKKKQTL